MMSIINGCNTLKKAFKYIIFPSLSGVICFYISCLLSVDRSHKLIDRCFIFSPSGVPVGRLWVPCGSGGIHHQLCHHPPHVHGLHHLLSARLCQGGGKEKGGEVRGEEEERGEREERSINYGMGGEMGRRVRRGERRKERRRGKGKTR